MSTCQHASGSANGGGLTEKEVEDLDGFRRAHDEDGGRDDVVRHNQNEWRPFYYPVGEGEQQRVEIPKAAPE